MDLKLFLSTFALIFFAELGDKTQLAAMASAAGGRSNWSVFLGASAALVFSTLIAVLVGSNLQRLAPVYLIKGVAGLLFLLFGVLLVVGALRARGEAMEAAPVPAAALPAHPGLISRMVMEAAIQFEQAAHQDYAALARQVANPLLQRLFEELAAEEEGHLTHMRALVSRHGTEQAVHPLEPQALPRYMSDGGKLLDEERAIVEAARKQEKAKADFYTELARLTHLPALKSAFQNLAQAEMDHLHRIERAAGMSESA